MKSARKHINPFPGNVREIAVVAPAGKPDRARLEASLELIGSWGIKTLLGEHVFSASEEEYFSAPKEKRIADFNAAVNDHSVDMILCARGGYGSAQLLPGIDWTTLRKRRLPVLGYSDITAIHMGMLKLNAGIPVTCQMAASFTDSLKNAFTAESMRRALAVAHTAYSKPTDKMCPAGGKQLQIIRGGSGSGRLVAANLSLLASLCGTEFMPDLSGCVLLLEDVGEKPRIIDRHLTQLHLNSLLDKCAVLVFCNFKSCGGKGDIDRIIRRFAGMLDMPVLSGLPFGHCSKSLSFVCGEAAATDGKGNLLVNC